MDLHTRTVTCVILCLLSLSAGQKHGKRRPFQALQAKQQLFIPPVQQQPRTTQPPPPPQPATVEVQQAEVQSGEFLAANEQGPPPTAVQPPFQSQFQPQFQFQPQQQQRSQPRQGGRPNQLPKEYTTPIPIISLNKQQSIDGSYKSSYETANSIQAEETGFLKNLGVPDQEALVQFGSYSYTDPDGKVISVTYTADEGGFRATGDHLPTPPPIPPDVQKGLDIIYESIRVEAERQAKEKKFKLQKLESQNYPIDNKENVRKH